MRTYDGGLLRLALGEKFFLKLLQLQKVCEIGGDELHRPPVVALSLTVIYSTISTYKIEMSVPLNLKSLQNPLLSMCKPLAHCVTA